MGRAALAIPAARDLIASRHELAEPLRRNQPIAAADESLDFAPVGRFVQSDADPALGAEIGGNEKSRRLGVEDELPRALRDLAPEREPAVPGTLEGEDLVPTRYDGPRRMSSSFASGSARQIARRRAPIATSDIETLRSSPPIPSLARSAGDQRSIDRPGSAADSLAREWLSTSPRSIANSWAARMARAQPSPCASFSALPKRSARPPSSTSRRRMSTAVSITDARASISPNGWSTLGGKVRVPTTPQCRLGRSDPSRAFSRNEGARGERRPAHARAPRARLRADLHLRALSERLRARALARRSPGANRTRSPSPIR